MSITDELREWAQVHYGTGYSCQILAIADRIDRECLEHSDFWNDEKMAKHGWVRLPVDADGVLIHIGDVVEEFGTRTVGRACGEVIRIVFNKHSTGVRIDTGRSYADRNPANVRHVSKQPTVEDVLEEFYRTAKADSDANMGDLYETIADYAKRLRLAGEGE